MLFSEYVVLKLLLCYLMLVGFFPMSSTFLLLRIAYLHVIYLQKCLNEFFHSIATLVVFIATLVVINRRFWHTSFYLQLSNKQKSIPTNSETYTQTPKYP